MTLTEQRRNLRVWGHPGGAWKSSYVSWLRLKGCQIRKSTHDKAVPCYGPVEIDHEPPRRRGDFRHLWPLCMQHHSQKGSVGTETFAEIYGIDPAGKIDKLFRAWDYSPAGQVHADQVFAYCDELGLDPYTLRR